MLELLHPDVVQGAVQHSTRDLMFRDVRQRCSACPYGQNRLSPPQEISTFGRKSGGRVYEYTPYLPPQPLLQLGVGRVVAREHVIDVGHRDAVGALLAQEARERMHVPGRAVQRDHAG